MKIISVIREYENKYQKKIPVVSAGGVFDQKDMEHHMKLGVDGVQVGTRFVTTEECDAPESYKQAYIHAAQEDIVIVKSPVGMPGRAIKNSFLEKVAVEKEKITRCFQCLEHCDPKTIPYCITKALIRAAEGDIENALLFCGANAYRCQKDVYKRQVLSAVQTVSAPAASSQPAASAAEAPNIQSTSDNVVLSPLVGTFYSSSSPDAEPFVKVGDTVKKGQVLGIIEAMKLMNEIESDFDGVVEAILVNNEDVVEYGQPLFRIR